MTDHDKGPATARASMITSSFADRNTAEKAYADLRSRGYEDKDIHILMSDETRKTHFAGDVRVEHSNKALAGAGVGGAVGGAVGATIVGLMAAAAAVALPGIGLVVVGPLAGALAGGAAGATAGGVIGMLVGAGIPEDHAKVYEQDLKAGNVVLGVTPRTEADAAYLDREWRETGRHFYR